MTPEQRAGLAQSLNDNEAFQEALDDLRDEAMEALVSVSPDDKNAILGHQATVRVVDGLRYNFDAMILVATQKKPGIV